VGTTKYIGSLPRKLTTEDGKNVNDTNPTFAMNLDENNRVSQNTLFGEKLTAERVIDSAALFHYGLPTGTAAPPTIIGSAYLDPTYPGSLLTIGTGTTPNSSIFLRSNNFLRFVAGQETFCAFGWRFTTPISGSYQHAGIMTLDDGFYIGYTGTQFVFGRRKAGVDFEINVNIQDIQDNFHEDTFDPTKLNAYQIKYGYGCPTAVAQVMRADGTWYTFAKFKYPSTSTETLIDNPYLPIGAEIGNGNNAIDIVSASDFVSSGVIQTGSMLSRPTVRTFSGELTFNITAADTCLAVFRNKTEFFGKDNYINSYLQLISAATDLNKTARLKIIKIQESDISNTPTWNDIDTNNSTHEVTTDATLNAGAFDYPPYFPWRMAKVDTLQPTDLTNYFLELRPGELVAFVLRTASGGTSGTIDVAIRWNELF